MYWNNHDLSDSPSLVLQVEWIVLVLGGMFHLDDAFVGVVRVQHSVILSCQLEIEDIEVLLNTFGIR